MVDSQVDFVKIDLCFGEKQAFRGNIHRDHEIRYKILRSPVGRGVDLVGVRDVRIAQEEGRLSQLAESRAEPGGTAHRVTVRTAVGQKEDVVLPPQQSGGFLDGHGLLTVL